jgi:class 3 adenylate cyclase
MSPVAELPTTRYTQSGDVSVAYQVMGDGPFDLVIVPGVISHVEFFHELPGYTRFLSSLARFSRVVTFDKRGQGLSDRVSGTSSLEERMDDVRAVLAAVGSERAAIFGFSEGSAMSALFAATYPDKVQALVLEGGFARAVTTGDVPGLYNEEGYRVVGDLLVEHWGTGPMMLAFAPSFAGNEPVRAAYAKAERLSATPTAMRQTWEMDAGIDVSAVLPTIRVPTLVLHRRHESVSLEAGRYLAEHIPGARMVVLEGQDHAPWAGDSDLVVAEVERFLTGQSHDAAVDDRVLATVLFTDIVESTARASALGDASWRRLLDEHDAIVDREVARHRGRKVKTTGDGVLALFDGPARAVRCGAVLRDRLRTLGIEIRAGLHTGEIEIRGDDIGGIGVHIAARISALAGAGEILTSRTLKDLTAGSGLIFTDRGIQALKGVPDEWHVYAVAC